MTPKEPDRPLGPRTTGGQDAAIVFATQAGNVIFGLGIQSLLAYTLLPEGRGSFALCVVFASVLGVLFTPGAREGAQYFVMTRQATISEGVGAALAICLVGGALAVALAVPFVHSDIAFFHKAETHSFYLALALVPVTAFSGAMEYQLAGLQRFGHLAVFALVHVAANILVLLVLLWVGRLGVEGAVMAVVAAHGCTVALCVWCQRRHHGLVLTHPFRAVSARIVGYGLRFHPAGIDSALDMSAGVLILGLFASQGEIGLFATASALMFRLRMISDAVGNALLPPYCGRRPPGIDDVLPACRVVRHRGRDSRHARDQYAAGSDPLLRSLPASGPVSVDHRPGSACLCLHRHTQDLFQGYRPPGHLFLGCLPGTGCESDCDSRALSGGRRLSCSLGANLGNDLPARPSRGGVRRATRMRWLSIWLPRPGDAVSFWRAFRAALGSG